MFARFSKRKSKAAAPPQLSTPTDAHPRAFTVSPEGHHSASLPPRHTAPAVPHPSPHARLILHAGDEGLLVRPEVPAGQCASYVCVSWGEAKIYNPVFSPSRPVYIIKSITAIPLRKDQARTTLNGLIARKTPQTPNPLRPNPDTEPETPAEDVPDLTPVVTEPRVKFAPDPPQVLERPALNQSSTSLSESTESPTASGASTPLSSTSSLSGTTPVAKMLMNRLTFWSKPRTLGLAPPAVDTVHAQDTTHNPHTNHTEEDKEPEEALQKILDAGEASAPVSTEERNAELTRKILREVVRQYSSGCMYYSLDVDLSTSLQDKHDQFTRIQRETAALDNLAAVEGKFSPSAPATPQQPIKTDAFAEPHALLPLWLRVPQRSRRFWWNEVLAAPFVEAGRFGSDNVFSYVQIRGSIPLFWSQPGLALKPPPKLDRPIQDTLPAARTHLTSCAHNCTTPNGAGTPVMCVNLVEKTGKEAVVGGAYGELVRSLQEGEGLDVKLVDFDFHAECRGMKYENISKLVAQLERTFEAQGYFWVLDGQPVARQRDRTNVVQSAFARYVMNNQLQAIAIVNPNPADVEADMVFNDVWANNGDAISRAYAGTSALKGDFTRTGRRDLSGILNDGRNSLARMYTSNFADYFSQATIDFMLGHRTTAVFSEFLLRLSSTDPREILKASKIRASAIETTIARVVLEYEHAVNAWTLLSPAQVGVTVADKFVEKILVLTASAIYVVCFDYEMDKVVSSRRVPLGDIVSIKQGAYILSTLHEASIDPVENYGFSITYRPTRQDIRLTTYSMRNKPAPASPTLSSAADSSPQRTPIPTPTSPQATFPFVKRVSTLRRGSGMLTQILSSSVPNRDTITDLETVSFKALPVLDLHPDQIGVAPATCRDAARRIVRDVWAGCKSVGNGHESGFIVEEDIVSLEEAQRITPMWAQLEYSFKRFLWLGS
ncbi:hypothetical protein FRC06_001582 [Ceratobasidium sp. 370]|nr:hypothetical protein FRC06_001582 [Ceratobasidium sp. 370]